LGGDCIEDGTVCLTRPTDASNDDWILEPGDVGVFSLGLSPERLGSPRWSVRVPCRERLPWCGNGTLQGFADEECDDGNDDPGAGCFDCESEPGWLCESNECREILSGDGIVDWGEEICDDANSGSGDGCSSECAIEEGWLCWGDGTSFCESRTCGDGARTQSGGRDDGNPIGGDGCSENCAIEILESAGCGDGRRAPSLDEGYDDGDLDSGDDCTDECRVENGYVCFGRPSICRESLCGNSRLEFGESCDDGNDLSGDGYATAKSNCRTPCVSSKSQPGFSAAILDSELASATSFKDSSPNSAWSSSFETTVQRMRPTSSAQQTLFRSSTEICIST
jgi:cysteine-rich repeat protein